MVARTNNNTQTINNNDNYTYLYNMYIKRIPRYLDFEILIYLFTFIQYWNPFWQFSL